MSPLRISTLLFVLVGLTIFVHQSSSQDHVPVTETGTVAVFDSPPFMRADGQMVICGRSQDNRYDVYEQVDKRTFIPSALKTSGESGFPVAPSENGQWFGYEDRLTFVGSDGNRVVISPIVSGRETKTKAIRPIGGDSVLVTYDEYTVIRREVIDGVRFTWIDSTTHRVELCTPTSREVLLNDTTRAHKYYSNAVPLGHGRYAVAMLGGDSVRQCLAIIEANKSVSFIDEPQYLEVDAYPTYLHVGSDGRLYSFLHLLNNLQGLWLPGVIIYDENTGSTTYRQLPEIYHVNHAVNVENMIVAGDDRGVLIFNDDIHRFVTVLYPGTSFYARVTGVTQFDERTLAAYYPWGVFYYPINELLPTGVHEASPGVAVGSDRTFDVSLDAGSVMNWQLVDLNGRQVMSGTKGTDESGININTGALTNGVYMLVVQRADNVVHTQRVLVQH